MKLIHKLGASKRSTLSLDEYINYFNFNGLDYPYVQQSNPGQPAEEVGGDFRGLIEGAFKQNGIVFACMAVRQLLFQEARFQFRRMEDGRPGEYFSAAGLAPLVEPWPNATTGSLLARMIQDVDLAGNWYGVRIGNEIRRLRPDHVTIVLASVASPDYPGTAPDARPVGYVYDPPQGDTQIYLPEQVAHFAPIPDPSANFRGMSWLTPVIREIMADQAATTHKLKYFEQGATSNMVVKFDPGLDQSKVEAWIALMEGQIGGAENAYRTLYLGGGADANVVGSNLQQVDFKAVQGAGETRIAAAAGVPPVIAGFSEGLQAATYSNYSQARRRFADGTMRPLWRAAAGALASIIRVPGGTQLWYDDRDIPFLQEDLKDAADIQKVNAESIKGLTEAGYEPQSVVDAVNANDLSRLQHSGMYSVQLQTPGASQDTDPEPTRMVARRTGENPAGEAHLRAIAGRFRTVEGEVQELLRQAVEGQREARLGEALVALDSLRGERPEAAVADAYAAAFDGVIVEEKAENTDPVKDLAYGLRAKLQEAVDTAESNAPDAFRSVSEDNLDEMLSKAVVAFVDDAEREWSLGSWAANQINTLGRRATSTGIKDGVGDGYVQYSQHGTTHPACKPREGKIYKASDAPTPPLHENCGHTLIPVPGPDSAV